MLLTCDNLSKYYGDRKLFSGLSFSVDKGERLAIIGRNGCGKTTLLNILAGKDEPDSGFVKLSEGRLSYLMQQVEDQSNTLSGGERTKLLLNQIFDEKPSVMILDEPTNHLDMASLLDLESRLKSFKGALIIVSHDRYMLDNIATKVLDLNTNPPKLYKGNYSSFTKQKDIMLKTNQNIVKKAEDKIRHEKQVIEKLKSFNREKSIKRAESREKLLARLDRPDVIKDDKTKIELNLAPEIESGKDVLIVTDISKSFGERNLFKDVSFDLRRGEHVGIIGGNGTGKSTIFRILTGEESLDLGEIKVGTNVSIGYYDQSLDKLNDEKTLFDEISDGFNDLNNTKIRNTLAAFSFYEDDVFKRISALSGGERGRLALCKLMLGRDNLLLLDEPTNHLDIESREILEDALNCYEGTVLFISHDRYFLNKCADRILELWDESLTGYLGNYDEYLNKKAELIEKGIIKVESNSVTAIPTKEKSEAKLSWEEQKRQKALEEKIKRDTDKLMAQVEELDEKIAAIDSEIANPANASDHVKLSKLVSEKDELTASLNEAYEKLEELL